MGGKQTTLKDVVEGHPVVPVSIGVKKDGRKLRFYSANMGAGAVLQWKVTRWLCGIC